MGTYKKVKLTDIADINPKTSFENLEPSTEVSFIPMQSVSEEGRIIDYQVKQFDEVKKGYTSFVENDILLAKITPCMENGKRAIATNLKNGIGFGSTEFHVIRPKESVIPKYLFYFISQDRFRKLAEQNMTGSAGQKRVPATFLKSISLYIPPLDIQRKIIYILDKAQELIDKRKAQIEALDQLTQSVFLEMFGNLKGEKVPLSELCDVNPSKKEIENIDKELPVTFLPMANVSENGELDLSETRLIKEVFDGFTYFREGDVLFAKITPCMENGKGAIASNLINNIGFGSTEFHVLRPKENVNSTWLYYLTSLQSFRKQAEANMTGSAGQKRVPKQFFSKYKVVLPPIELQNQFAEIVHKIQSQKEIMKKSLEELENNFNSLMQRAFKGEMFND